MFRRIIDWLRGGPPRPPPAARPAPRHHRPQVESLEDRTVPATVLPPGFEETTFARGFPMPTSMSFAPDGRLFVTLQNGIIDVVKDGQLLPTPFLTVPANTF